MAGLTGAGLSRLVLGPAMAAFAIQVRHYPQTGDPAWRRGIFKADHAILGDGGQVDYSTTAPALGIRDDEWPVLPRMNDRLTIGETAYEIQDIQPDGPNIGRTLILRRCSRNPDKPVASAIGSRSIG